MEQLANLWLSRLVAPAFTFWALGVFAWAWAHDLPRSLSRLDHVLLTANATAPLAITVAALLVIAVSGVVAQPLALPILRLLEGYWWRRLDPVRSRIVARQRARLRRLRVEWLSLAQRGLDRLSAGELNRYAELDEQLQLLPDDPELLMPTRLGNILRAAESYPQQRYGLNSIVCWPRLWLLLPVAAKEELNRARSQLDNGALVVFWSLASLLWGVLWVSWLVPLALVVALATYQLWLLRQAQDYADLFKATFDVHRRLLYDALGFAVPADPTAEQSLGEAVTLFLWRGERPAADELPAAAGSA